MEKKKKKKVFGKLTRRKYKRKKVKIMTCEMVSQYLYMTYKFNMVNSG